MRVISLGIIFNRSYPSFSEAGSLSRTQSVLLSLASLLWDVPSLPSKDGVMDRPCYSGISVVLGI